MTQPNPRPARSGRARPAAVRTEARRRTRDRFFDLESMDDPGQLLARATELALAFRAAADRATEFQAIAAAQLADPRRFDRLTPRSSPSGPAGPRTTRRRWSSTARA